MIKKYYLFSATCRVYKWWKDLSAKWESKSVAFGGFGPVYCSVFNTPKND